MNYDFFHSMTEDESQEYLNRFLTEVRDGFAEMKKEMTSEGLTANYKLDNFEDVFDWMQAKIRTFSKEADKTLPDWIRNTTTYQENLFDFDDKSKIIINRLAYYLGEAFVRSFDGLYWSTGEKGIQFENMPVIKGFKSNRELPVMTVSEVMFRRRKKNVNYQSNELIDLWLNEAPK